MIGRSNANGISYRLDGAGAPVVLIHGVGGNLGNWDGVCQILAADFSLLRMDLRGHGESGPIRGRYSLEQFADDVVSAMDAAGIDKAHLAGFSLGGLIAQVLALNFPLRFLNVALISAVAGRTPDERARVTERLATIRELGVAGIVGMARDRWFTERFARENPEAIERRIAELLANDKESYLEAYRVFGESELLDRLHEIGHRTFVLTGEGDPGSNPRMARAMHEKIANSKLEILPRLKHGLLIEAPCEIAARLKSFFSN